MRKFPFWCLFIVLLVTACDRGGEMIRPGEGRYEYTFEFYNPDATKVFLAGEMSDWKPDRLLMKKDDDGYWRLTLYLEEGRWQYKFVADDVWIHDSENDLSVSDGFGGSNSVIVIGNMMEDMVCHDDIPHGTVTNLTLTADDLSISESLKKFNLYFPPGYDDSDEEYPVLFLLHGYGEDEYQWLDDGFINNFMDNAIYKEIIRPFIVVMPAGGTSFYIDDVDTFISERIYGYITENLRVKTGPDNTAVSGMSMGGFGAFSLAWNNPGMFGLSIPLSGYYDKDKFLNRFDDEIITSDFELIIYCAEDDSLCYPSNEDFMKILRRDDVIFESVISESGGHTWRYWSSITTQALTRVSDYFYSNES